nr:apolipoprotein A1/A4/E family protein [Saccharopolyspora sp. HNM0983]
MGGAAEQAKTPLLAVLGAGDLAAQTVYEAVQKVRTQLNERVEHAQQDLPADLTDLRARIEPAQLRKRVDDYAENAKQLYGYLAERGEGTLERLQSQPQVQRVRDQVETAQDRVGETVGEVRELADDVLGKVSRTSREAGDKAADAADEVRERVADTADEAGAKATEAAEKVADAADEAASKVSSATGSTKSTSKSGGAKGSSGSKSTAKKATGKNS